MKTQAAVRPTKKQREILTYIEQFIGEHGYSPSYREIMNGLQYTSVATVSLHVNSLIRRGHLRKRDRSARSLEVVSEASAAAGDDTRQADRAGEAWLFAKVGALVDAYMSPTAHGPAAEDIEVTLQALRILGYEAAAQGLFTKLQTPHTTAHAAAAKA